MKKANSIIVLLMMSLLLGSFSYINSNNSDPMLTRHDKDEAEFLQLAKKFENYMCHLNLPDCEGTIIADQWALSAAHCAIGIVEKFKAGGKHFVIINDVEVEVDKVIIEKEWGNPEADMSALNDIALLHLKTKPVGAMQAKLYMDEDEVDKLIYMVGRGDKGNGLTGVDGNDKKQRGATNRIETATEKWLTWTFDHPDTQTKYLTEYEGISGPGDSGGPAFIVKNNTVYLAGVSSWQDRKGQEKEGFYGVVENYTRVSQYIEWINEEMTGNGSPSKAMLRVAPKPDAIDYRKFVNATILKQYVGAYQMEEITIKVYAKENGTKLYLFVAGQPEYELTPTAEHKFSFVASAAYKVAFKKAANGLFKELIVTQPEGTFTAVRK